MIVDVFTHPRAPETAFWDSGCLESSAWFSNPNNLRYFDLIMQKAEESKFAILIFNGDYGGTFLKIPPERRFLSDSGFVNQEDENRLRSILQGSQERSIIKVHGAFYGICLTNTAIQFYSLVKYGRFLHPCDPDSPIEPEELRAGNVSYGAAYKPREELSERLFSRAQLFERPDSLVFEFT